MENMENMENMKKTKKRIMIICSVLILIAMILFLPIPTGKYDDGGTRTYRSLTYTIVAWNRYISEVDENGKTVKMDVYHKVSVFWFPDSQKNLTELWEIEQANN